MKYGICIELLVWCHWPEEKKILRLFSRNKGGMKQIHTHQLRGICLDKMCHVLFWMICMNDTVSLFFLTLSDLHSWKCASPFKAPEFCTVKPESSFES